MAPHGLEELIDRIQAEQGITYAPQQRQAVELAATSQVMLLTGGPGTCLLYTSPRTIQPAVGDDDGEAGQLAAPQPEKPLHILFQVGSIPRRGHHRVHRTAPAARCV